MERPPARQRHPRLLGRTDACVVLDELIAAIRRGESRALVVRGEAGIGKTALLDYLLDAASDLTVLRAVGVESEMELAYASLHQLCGPLLDRLATLPAPQRHAVEMMFGLSAGEPPDRFLVGLAVLGLFSRVAEQRPLLCVVDDAQWLDQASALTLAFVARRLLAESVGIVFAARDAGPELQHVPELAVQGLRNGDARALLSSTLPFKLDQRVRNRIVAETHGNPLALLELPRGLTATQLAGGYGLLGPQALIGRIEESFVRRLGVLSEGARRLLLVAAAEPVGDPLLLWRAAERLGIAPAVATTVEADGLLVIDERVVFRHPLLRSAVYGSATAEARRSVHRALAEATDQAADPDRRAWHLAAAAEGPDEATASELERSAARAQARGGLGAAAAFLERAARLSPDPSRRATRMLEAASAERDAGAPDAALRLLGALHAEVLDDVGRARAEMLHGQIAFDQFRVGEAARSLAGAAQRLEPVAVNLARKTHLEAVGAAMWAGDHDGPAGTRAIAEAALRAPPPPAAPTASDALLEGCALLLTKGHQAAVPSLRRARKLMLAPHVATDDHAQWLWFAVAGNAITVPQELWDADAWRALTVRHERFARDTGALRHLQFALAMLAWVHMIAGEPGESAACIEEDRTIAKATGNPPIPYGEMLLAAWLGQERKAAELIDATLREAPAGGRVACYAAYAGAVLRNGLGRHDEARDAARSAFQPDHLGYGPFVVPELAEAAARTGDEALLASLLEWLTERTRVTRTEWSLATEARVRALMSEGAAADRAYREAIDRLGRTWLRPELARAHLLYGEWLRRQGRCVDARAQLRTAHEMVAAIGMEAFAERARVELLATGETVRKRTVEARDDLTAQERQIARLARDGLSNPEIGARLFLSPRTVEWHLHNVFTKLGIRSRRQLSSALASPGSQLVPV